MNRNPFNRNGDAEATEYRGVLSRVKRHRGVIVLVVLLVIQTSLLLRSGAVHSPVLDEVGHLTAGLNYWRTGQFWLYNVNPPLTRLVGTFPLVFFSGATDDVFAPGSALARRPEWTIGKSYIRNHPDTWFSHYRIARAGCISFVIVGTIVCYRWARLLYGVESGLVAAALWCFCPNVLGWGATITPDVAGASMGVLAGFCFWKWCRRPSWWMALIAGVTLGLAELTKSTWLLLFLLWPLIGTIIISYDRSGIHKRQGGGQLALILLLGLHVLNLGYAYEGTGRQLGSFVFVSRALAGDGMAATDGGGNRFLDQWLGQLPVPLPSAYVQGIDSQRLDFEVGKRSFLNGEWKPTGWWYYYIEAIALKVPVGTLIIAIVALGVSLNQVRYRSPWRDELLLAGPAIAVFLLVSSQTGFSRYLRYILPAFPFAFIWMSRVAQSIAFRDWRLVAIGALSLCWSIASSLWCFPHSLGYFNIIAGGPSGGHRYLLDANVDWGQNLWFLRDWYMAHPEARPLYCDPFSFVDPEMCGITDVAEPPRGLKQGVRPEQYSQKELLKLGPRPGWYAISVHNLLDPEQAYSYLLSLPRTDTVAYSYWIYRVSLDDANRIRRTCGLPELGNAELGNAKPAGRDSSHRSAER